MIAHNGHRPHAISWVTCSATFTIGATSIKGRSMLEPQEFVCHHPTKECVDTLGISARLSYETFGIERS